MAAWNALPYGLYNHILIHNPETIFYLMIFAFGRLPIAVFCFVLSITFSSHVFIFPVRNDLL